MSHPSIVMIRSKISASTFSFREVTDTEVKKEITNLDPKKAIPHGNIPIKGDVRSNFYHIFFLSNLKVFFLTITKIYILSIFVFLLPKYSALKFFYCCHGCNICDVKIALFSKLRLRKKSLVKAFV